MTSTADLIAFCSAQSLPAAESGAEAPDWIHILPSAGGTLSTSDGRGPYKVADPQSIIDLSFERAPAGEIAIDVDHAIGRAARDGGEAPARGWITQMEVRDNGVWGKVNWTPEGRELVASQAYRCLSPVITYLKNGLIRSIREVSLVNRPNLRGLHALNQEGVDMFHQKVAKALGLGEDASEDAIMAALTKALKGGGDKDEKAAMQSVIDPIAEAVGLEGGASAEDVLTAITAKVTAGDGATEEFTAMQAENASLKKRVDALEGDSKKKAATDFIDGAIREGRAGVRPKRDEFIAMHMENPTRIEGIVEALPKLSRSHATDTPPAASKAGKAGLTAEQAEVCAMLGQDPEEYAKSLAELGETEEAL